MIALSKAPPTPHDILSGHTRHRIRRKAQQLVGMAGFRSTDRDDIEQELTLRVWRGLQGFDSTLGHSAAFITTVLDRAANSLLRLRNSGKRGRCLTHQVSLPPFVAIEDAPDETDPTVDVSDVGSHETAFELVHDVAVVLQKLPTRLRQLAEDLKSHSVTEIAQRSGLSRSTIYARMAELRAAFIAAGLKNTSETVGHFATVSRSL